MIFLVDNAGNIAVASVEFLQTAADPILISLLATQTWCFSMAQASEIARERRRRRRAPF